MLEKSYFEKADEIIAHYGPKPSSLIPIMQDVQEAFRYLPGELLTYVADQIGVTDGDGVKASCQYGFHMSSPSALEFVSLTRMVI